ncbi:MAG: GDP-mannose 4,6-dehydratase [Proteobacteria bacterium]|nr:GDP-mannose 4,6-dehydratase [Pseudomonadota bacterium]
MKTALIIGCNGQDGKITKDLLLNLNYSLVCVDKDYVQSYGNSFSDKVDIENFESVSNLIRSIKFDEIYFLAAYHHSSQEREQDNLILLKNSYAVNVYSLFNFLEAIRLFSKDSRLFYASSSLIFAGTNEPIQNELTPFCPTCIYGITKLDGMMLCRLYREDHGVFASVGILYNHESIYRPEHFLSKKIIKTVLAIKHGNKEKLIIGDLNAEIDWGYANDYVDAFIKIMELNTADDFIVATGKANKVMDFIKITFDHLSLDWRKHVEEDKNILYRKRKTLVGDSSKLMDRTGWTPNTSFKQMIELLLKEEDVAK